MRSSVAILAAVLAPLCVSLSLAGDVCRTACDPDAPVEEGKKTENVTPITARPNCLRRLCRSATPVVGVDDRPTDARDVESPVLLTGRQELSGLVPPLLT